MKPRHRFASLVGLMGLLALAPSAWAAGNNGEVRFSIVRISPTTVRVGQSIRITFDAISTLRTSTTFRAFIYQCKQLLCSQKVKVGTVYFRLLPAPPGGTRRQRFTATGRVLQTGSNMGDRIRFQILFRAPNTIRVQPRALYASANFQSRNQSSSPAARSMAAAGAAARAVPGQSRIQNAGQERLQRVGAQVLQELQRERQLIEQTMARTRGGQLMANLQQALLNYMRASSRYSRKKTQCAQRSYSREDDRRAGCTQSDTVEQCDRKRIHWCSRSEANQLNIALRSLRTEKEAAARAINGLDTCLSRAEIQRFSRINQRSRACMHSISNIMGRR